MKNKTPLQLNKSSRFIRKGSTDNLYISDSFFSWQSLNHKNSNKLMPYEFVIVDENDESIGRIVLNIPPQDLSMDNTAATVLTVMQKGVLEEHNGAPLRPIRISGVTGISANSSQSTSEAQSSGLAKATNYLFRNTIAAARRTSKNAEALLGTGKKTVNPLNITTENDPETLNWAEKSGFSEFHRLGRFFDYYLALKKTKNGRSYRLGFNMYKDQMFYFVKLSGYTLNKTASSLEYRYSVSLVAWQRKSSAVGSKGRPKTDITNAKKSSDSINAISLAMKKIRQARTVISSARSILLGISTDFDSTFMATIKDIMLLGYDITGIVPSVIDFTGSFMSSAKGSILAAQADLKGLEDSYSESVKLMKQFSVNPTDTIKSRQASGQSVTTEPSEAADPYYKMFEDPEKFYPVFSTYSINDIERTSQMNEAIESEYDRVNSLTADDFRQKKQKMQLASATVSFALGGYSQTYSRVFNVPSPKNKFTKLTTSSIEILNALNDAVSAVDSFISALDNSDSNEANDYSQFYSDYSNSEGIPFEKSSSKFYIPFPYESTLDSLAYQYLGDSNRWQEIAAINGLKAPYVDENGFEIPIVGSGSGQTVSVSSTDRLYIGQVIEIRSKTQSTTKRKITKIDRLSPTSTIVSFNGPNDLSIYKSSDEAHIKAFMPDTVNSQRLIAIPSKDSPEEASPIKIYPGLEDEANLVKLSMTDFLLSSSGDLIISSNGDIKLAYGYQNLLQAANMMILTPQGSLLNNVDFGNPIQSGTNTSDFNTTDALSSLADMFAKDSRFTGLNAGQINVSGPVASVSILIGLTGTNLNLPLKTELPT